jgi:hypothetical protein
MDYKKAKRICHTLFCELTYTNIEYEKDAICVKIYKHVYDNPKLVYYLDSISMTEVYKYYVDWQTRTIKTILYNL